MNRKRCIFCLQLKEERDFNKEHIILHSLGGKGENNFYYNVCKECNSNLGRKVDVIISDAAIVKFARFIYKIKGKSGVTNPFSNMPIEYDKSGITGKIETNKNGEIIGFRADLKKYLDKEGNMLLIGPRKNISDFVKRHSNEFSDKNLDAEIESKLWKIQNPKIPRIEYIEIPKENVDDFLVCISLPLLKMAYEYSYTRLGNAYLEDETAKEICAK